MQSSSIFSFGRSSSLRSSNPSSSPSSTDGSNNNVMTAAPVPVANTNVAPPPNNPPAAGAARVPSENTCLICLEAVLGRGGVPLFSNGCCGQLFHLPCIQSYANHHAAGGPASCPACRSPLLNLPTPAPGPAVALAAPPVAPLMAQQVLQQPQQQQQGGLFSQWRLFNAPAQAATTTSPLTSDEDPLPAAGRSANTTASTAALPVVTVSTSPEYRESGLSEDRSFHVRATVTYEDIANADEAETADAKPPLDLVCILDNSGSMSGSKLQSLKQAMAFVISQLDERDRLSVIKFNSTATKVHGLACMDENKRTLSEQMITRDIQAGGGTDIFSGMSLGWRTLQERRMRNPCTSIFLLTDGQDRSNVSQKMALVAQMKSEGVSLFVFGFGNDHDSAHLSALADAAEGQFIYIESDDMVADAFGGSIGTQRSGLPLRDITFYLRACERDVRIMNVMSGYYQHVIAEGQREARVTFLNMFKGERRDVTVQLHLPNCGGTATIEDYGLLTAFVQYYIQSDASETRHESSSSTCMINRVGGDFNPSIRERDLHVDLLLMRNMTTSTIQRALEFADRHDLESARKHLNDAIEELQASVCYKQQQREALSLMQDLSDAKSKVRDRSEYEQRGGRAYMASAYEKKSKQRSCYSRADEIDIYQTVTSVAAQSAAFRSKASSKSTSK